MTNIEFKIKNIDETIKEIIQTPSEKILSEFPKLTPNLTDQQVKKTLLHFYKENKGKLAKAQKTFQRTWNSTNEDFMKTVKEVTNIEPVEDIIVEITINPDTKNTEIFWKTKATELRDTIFPKILSQVLNLDTKYNDIMTHTILSDSKFQKRFKYRNKPNPKYEQVFIDNNFLLNHIDNFYKNKKSFEDFLKTTWEFIQKNENKIKEQLQ